MSGKNNKHAWAALACALLVLGLGLVAFATVGGAVDESPTLQEKKIRKVPAVDGFGSQCEGVMLAGGTRAWPGQWLLDDRETPWRP